MDLALQDHATHHSINPPLVNQVGNAAPGRDFGKVHVRLVQRDPVLRDLKAIAQQTVNLLALRAVNLELELERLHAHQVHSALVVHVEVRGGVRRVRFDAETDPVDVVVLLVRWLWLPVRHDHRSR